jgi:adenylate cyclase class 2
MVFLFDETTGIVFLIMAYLNIEIKATCPDPEFVRAYLKNNHAEFIGTDHQVDTYFNVKNGRLKLREGHIENNLIYYERNDQPGPKGSDFQLINLPDATQLKGVLSRSLGIKIIVEKKRDIWFIGNVKFHIDEVPGLGSFAEIEASNKYADVSKEELQKQCDFYVKELGITGEELISISYSDMLMASQK